MIYVIVGKPCSGKTTVREYFEKRGLEGYEASRFMRDAKRKHATDSEEALFKMLGRDFVSREIQEQITTDSDVVVSGFRVPEEIEFMARHNSVETIGVYAPDMKCFQRSLKRGRDKNNLNTFEAFFTKKICPDYSLGLAEIFARMVDHWLYNDREDYQKLFREVDRIFLGDNNG